MQIWLKGMVVLSVLCHQVRGQVESADGKPTPYLFPSFSEAILFYHTTEPQTASLNYHMVAEEMVMELREHKVPINDIETLDSILIQDKVFVRINEKFYEQLIAGPMQFLAFHRSTSQKAPKTGAYGSKAHTGGVEVLLDYEKEADFYDLVWSSKESIINRTEYWLKDGTSWYKANTLKQIVKVFPDQKPAIKQFVKEENLNAEDPQSLAKLIKFCLTKD